jgi:hypothetical protein
VDIRFHGLPRRAINYWYQAFHWLPIGSGDCVRSLLLRIFGDRYGLWLSYNNEHQNFELDLWPKLIASPFPLGK